jgi:hypothetical protein
MRLNSLTEIKLLLGNALYGQRIDVVVGPFNGRSNLEGFVGQSNPMGVPDPSDGDAICCRRWLRNPTVDRGMDWSAAG